MPIPPYESQASESPQIPKFEVPAGYTSMTDAIDSGIEKFAHVVEFKYLQNAWKAGQTWRITATLDLGMFLTDQPENSAVQYCVK